MDGINIFVKVIQCGGFSAAAKQLRMPVTTVSGKIASLEKRLGVTLIQRTTRKIHITPAGQTYFKHCLEAVETMAAADRELSTSKLEPRGLLRLTAPPDVGHLLLPPIVRAYLNTYPDAQVELILTSRPVDLIDEGVDLALRAGPMKDSSLVARKFLDVHPVLLASSAYAKKHPLPRHPSDLIEHVFVSFTGFGDRFKFTHGAESAKVSLTPRLRVDDIEAVKVFLSAGEGIAILPAIICQSEIQSGKLVRVLPKWDLDIGSGFRHHLSFVYPPQKFVPPKVQAFIELALKNAPEST